MSSPSTEPVGAMLSPRRDSATQAVVHPNYKRLFASVERSNFPETSPPLRPSDNSQDATLSRSFSGSASLPPRLPSRLELSDFSLSLLRTTACSRHPGW